MLITNVILGMFNHWASMFILPTAVVENITQICRNVLRGDKGLHKNPLCGMAVSMFGEERWGTRSQRLGSMEEGNYCKVGLFYSKKEGFVVGQMGAWQIFKAQSMVGL